MPEDKNTWMGQKGFDEAEYYKDEKFEIGIDHSDPEIKAKALEAISRNELIKNQDINVDVTEGVLLLTGTVQDEAMKAESEKAVCGLTGVKSIRNTIVLRAH